ncbi:hypothetical protein QO009_003007 [Brevibacillus aydinogluensis]|jgi:hypothetical protein|uniref:hypothetical protein n=1 Tax=Brevibacillus aydinogluensis TaxID=927786 RepID=UPI0028938053|nr:hypothetical protein [Brevibacillus aydinogluensis]MDT3417112.1 hypothetical protein [Brevibacillus aydinogluensis]
MDDVQIMQLEEKLRDPSLSDKERVKIINKIIKIHNKGEGGFSLFSVAACFF